MRINEIITESEELEEGWKSKLGAAALAGAAMLGGGHADAQAQNYQPTAQSQQSTAGTPIAQANQIVNNLVKNQPELKRYLVPGTEFGKPIVGATFELRGLAQRLGNLEPFAKSGRLTPEQLNLYKKMVNVYLRARLQINNPVTIDKIFSGAVRFASGASPTLIPQFVGALRQEEQKLNSR
jgi:hypothetical protein